MNAQTSAQLNAPPTTVSPRTKTSDVTQLLPERISSLLLHDGMYQAIIQYVRGQKERLMLGLCSEPGSGTTQLINEVINRLPREVHVYRRNFEGATPDYAAREMRSLYARLVQPTDSTSSQLVPATPPHVIVVFDEVPPADERMVKRHVAALHAFWQRGICVVVLLAPEAFQLFEALPTCQLFLGSELTIPFAAGNAGDIRWSTLYEASHGIPALVTSGLLGDGKSRASLALSATQHTMSASGTNESPMWRAAVDTLISASLRAGLCEEDKMLRLVCMFLGSGSISTVKECLFRTGKRVDTQSLKVLREMAPFFGITEKLDTFSCVVLHTDKGLETHIDMLADAAQEFMSLIQAVWQVLIRQERYYRAALLVPLIHVALPDTDRFVCQHAARFIHAGAEKTVLCSLERCIEAGMRANQPHLDEHIMILEALFRRKGTSLSASQMTCQITDQTTDYPTDHARTQTEMFFSNASMAGTAARNIGTCAMTDLELYVLHQAQEALFGVFLLNISQLTQLISSRNDLSVLARRTILHLQAYHALLNGKAQQALHMLLAESISGEPMSLIHALLTLDTEVASLLVGEGGFYEEHAVAAAEQFLLARRDIYFDAYVQLFRLVQLIFWQRPYKQQWLEQLLIHAEREHITMLHIVAYLVGSLCDVKHKAFARAHVRVHLARKLLEASELSEFKALNVLLTFVGELIYFLQEGKPQSSICSNKPLYSWAFSCMCAQNKSFATEFSSSAARLAYEAAPVSAFWLLHYLVEGLGSFSEYICLHIPESWQPHFDRKQAVWKTWEGSYQQLRRCSPFLLPEDQELLRSMVSRQGRGFEAAKDTISRIYARSTEDATSTSISMPSNNPYAKMAECAGIIAPSLYTAITTNEHGASGYEALLAHMQEMTATQRISAILQLSDAHAAIELLQASWPLYIQVLGSFSATHYGETFPQRAFNERGAHILMICMALQRGKPLPRYRLAEHMFPQLNYLDACNRVYQTTSIVRKALSRALPEQEPLISSRVNKTLMFDPHVVRSDLDDLHALILKQQETQGAAERIRIGLVIEQLYQGDICLPDIDVQTEFLQLQASTRESVRGAMVMAGQSALKISDVDLALHFARQAISYEELREDAFTILVKSLLAVGKISEARSYYERLCSELKAQEERCPSRELRMLMERAKADTSLEKKE